MDINRVKQIGKMARETELARSLGNLLTEFVRQGFSKDGTSKSGVNVREFKCGDMFEVTYKSRKYTITKEQGRKLTDQQQVILDSINKAGKVTGTIEPGIGKGNAPKPEPKVQEDWRERGFRNFCTCMSPEEIDFSKNLTLDQFLGYQKLRYAGWHIQSAFDFCQRELALPWDKIDYAWLMQFVPISPFHSNPPEVIAGIKKMLKEKAEASAFPEDGRLSFIGGEFRDRNGNIVPWEKVMGNDKRTAAAMTFSAAGQTLKNNFMQVKPDAATFPGWDGPFSQPAGESSSASGYLVKATIFDRFRSAWQAFWFNKKIYYQVGTVGHGETKHVPKSNVVKGGPCDVDLSKPWCPEGRMNRKSQKKPVHVTDLTDIGPEDLKDFENFEGMKVVSTGDYISADLHQGKMSGDLEYDAEDRLPI